LADRLIAGAETALALASGLALLYLFVGLIRPAWAWATKRRSVVRRAIAIMLLAVVGFAGVIGYTLTLPDNPHSIERYLKDFDKQGEPPAPGQ
jgi:hypothetical protein